MFNEYYKKRGGSHREKDSLEEEEQEEDEYATDYQEQNQYEIENQIDLITNEDQQKAMFQFQQQNPHNYEFLYDEEYQNFKEQKDLLSTQKWHVLCQKLGLQFALNQVSSTLFSLNGFLSKQKQASDKLMYICEESMRTKSSSTYNTTQNQHNLLLHQSTLGMSGILSYQKEIQSCYKNYDEQSQQWYNQTVKLNMRDLMSQVGQVSRKVEKKVHSMVKSQCELLLKFEKEMERNEYLIRELQKKDSFRSSSASKQSSKQEQQQESYIEDLEVQLQETRAALLDKKIKLSDKEEEIKILKKQVESLSKNFMQLEKEKKEIDNLLIKVSQQLKLKELNNSHSGSSGFEIQLQSEKEHLSKQIEYNNKQILEEREKVKSLEMIESDLLHKLEMQAQEILNYKKYVGEIEEKLELKSDAIEKAHKVIQRLNEEMEKGANSFAKLEQEREALKKESKDLSKKVAELNKQIQTNINQQYIANAQLNGQLKTEVDELKEALRQYQYEFEQEKGILMEQVRELNESKYELQQEKEKVDSQIKKLQIQIEEEQEKKNQLVIENNGRIKKLEQELKEMEEHYKHQLETREQSAQSNIFYMQRRLKEVTSAQDENQHKRQKSQSKETQQKVVISNSAYLLEIKQEFDKITEEFLEIRNIVKSECIDKSSICHKIRLFEEFRVVFIDQLSVFENKAIELSELSQKYEKQLDEQKKLFLVLKSLVKEKDQLIYAQQKQLLIRDQVLRNNMGILGKELERSCQLVGNDLFQIIAERDNEVRFLKGEKVDLEKRFVEFKNEFVELLDDRDQSKNDNLKLFGQIEVQKREICQKIEDHQRFMQKLRSILNIKHPRQQNQENEMIRMIEEIVDELKIRRDEVIQYKQQIHEYSGQSEEEKKFLQGRIQAMENQLEIFQRESLKKEEEIQVQYLQKETKYINEVQRLQTECSGIQNEAQLREKQNKKLQEKLSNSLMEIDCLQKEVDALSREKMELMDREEKMGDELNSIQDMMEQTQLELNQRKETMEMMENQMKNQEEKQMQLNASLYDKEKEISKERELNLQLQDEKFQSKSELEKAKEAYKVLEKENQNLYQELRRYKDHIIQLQNNIKTSEYEREDLKRAYTQMSTVMQQAQQEMADSQQTLDDLKKQVEEGKYKDKYIQQLKEEIKSFSIQEQQLVIEIDLLKKLLNPDKVNAEVQTKDSGIQEIIFMREEMGKCRKDAWSWGKEADTLRETLKRSNFEIDRLIQEKRELEDLVDQQNQSIKQIRLNQALKENMSVVNSVNQTLSPPHMGSASSCLGGQASLNNDLYNKIMQEKENYILRLESEMGEMRHEIETLKGKILTYEINKSQFGYSSLDNNGGGGLSNHLNNSKHIVSNSSNQKQFYNNSKNRTTSIQKDDENYNKYQLH